jgi:hypothetical protein
MSQWRQQIDKKAAANGDLTEEEINSSLMIESEIAMMC